MTLLLLALASGQEVQGFAELRASAVVGAEGTPVQVVERFRPSFEAPLSERVRMGPGGLAAAGLGRGNEKGAQEGPERALSGLQRSKPFRTSAVF